MPDQVPITRLLTSYQNDSQSDVITCHECGLNVVLPKILHLQKALCPRCGLHLTTYRKDVNQHLVALSLSALIFLLAALPFEFLSFSAKGQFQSISIPSSIMTLIEQNYAILALLELAAIIVLPAIILVCILHLSLPLLFGKQPAYGQAVLKWIYLLLPWTMVEIFLIGVLVSLIKITTLADIGLGLSFYAYLLFTICLTAVFVRLDKHQLERQLERKPIEIDKARDPNRNVQTTWALLTTAVLLYIPANVLPIMHTNLLGRDDPSTILSGVMLLWQTGSYPVAIVIFVASVLVPVSKLIILFWLNYTVHKAQPDKTRTRMFWYRCTEFIGRWSMVDVFVVAILVSLIQLGNVMSIHPGPAALAFCTVVILTMLAAMSFDTRLIWQHHEQQGPVKYE